MKNLLKKIAIVILILGMLGGSYQIYMDKYANFHTVTKNVLHRSGQLRGDNYSYYQKKHHLKSMVNLRGVRNPEHSKWYRDELEFCERNNIKHLDYKISSTKFLSKSKIDEILNLMDNLPKPILIHCFGGSDRSGLISACWKYKIDNQSPKTAYKQLSFIYFHLPYFGHKTKAMDDSFWNYVKKSEE